MKKLRINFFSPFPPYKSGIVTYTQDLIRALDAKHVRVDRVNNDFWRYTPFLKVYSSRYAFAANKFFAIAASQFYKRSASRNTISHFFLSGGQHNYIVLKHFFSLSSPKILTIHETFYTRNFLNPLSEIDQIRIMKKADCIIVHTQELKNRLSYLDSRIKVIFHGVDVGKYRIDPNISKKKVGFENRITISCIGYLFRYKGIINFIKAVKGVNARVNIIGSGPSLGELKSFADEVCPGKIRFIPYVSDEDYPYYISASDIVVFPRAHSKGEASGVLVQAMASGKAIIANNIGCFREYLSKERGLLVDTENIKLFNRSISELVKSRRKREFFGSKSYLYAKKYLSWEKVAEKHIDIYKGVL